MQFVFAQMCQTHLRYSFTLLRLVLLYVVVLFLLNIIIAFILYCCFKYLHTFLLTDNLTCEHTPECCLPAVFAFQCRCTCSSAKQDHGICHILFPLQTQQYRKLCSARRNTKTQRNCPFLQLLLSLNRSSGILAACRDRTVFVCSDHDYKQIYHVKKDYKPLSLFNFRYVSQTCFYLFFLNLN